MSRRLVKKNDQAKSNQKKKLGKIVQRSISQTWLALQQESKQDTEAKGWKWIAADEVITFMIDGISFTCTPGDYPRTNPRLHRGPMVVVERIPDQFAAKAKEALQAKIAELNPIPAKTE